METEKRLNKPLPCCGVTPYGFEIEGDFGRGWYRLGCPKCGLHITAPNKEKATERWNLRVVSNLWQLKNG